MDFIDTDIKFLKGVGDAKAKALSTQMDISTFGDLLYTFPLRHIDRSRFYHIREFAGEMHHVQIIGSLVSMQLEGEGARQRLKALFSDGRSLLEVTWFSRISFFKDAFRFGVQYVIFGKPTQYNGSWQMTHPEIIEFDPAKPPTGFCGVYSIPDKMRKRGFGTRYISGLIRNLLDHKRYYDIVDPIPPEVRDKYHLMSLVEAFENIHFPKNQHMLQKAKERMKFEELYYLQLNILRYSRERGRSIRGYVFSHIGNFFNEYYSHHIPFDLTGAQKRVLREIRNDMRTGRQMNRLLQGDVGSGKTMVAFMTMLMACDNGFQAALMAPTEILASQHYETIKGWSEKLGLNVVLLTGSTRSKARCEIHAGLQSGDVNIIIGTHALIEDTVKFRSLGLVVIDEQHRFGVAQRGKMWKKGTIAPHVLVMTATPIPRTLAMTVYGDLDVSVIDELPPGRKPIQTLLRYEQNRNDIYQLMYSEIQRGRQAYIVYPLVKENEKLELKSVENGLERLKRIFPNVEIRMVHGKMKPAEKEAQMEDFISGVAKILVATTVIEVGVNVPNASVMIVENAERFGLSQLHQLRGRVGRGADNSYCILMTKYQIGADTKKRLNVMTSTTDGFLISEADMKMRGPGDMEGTQQSGIAFNLKIANLATDGQILTISREAAECVLNAHPELIEVPSSGSGVSDSYDGNKIQMSEKSVALTRAELRKRYFKQVDWSQIS